MESAVSGFNTQKHSFCSLSDNPTRLILEGRSRGYAKAVSEYSVSLAVGLGGRCEGRQTQQQFLQRQQDRSCVDDRLIQKLVKQKRRCHDCVVVIVQAREMLSPRSRYAARQHESGATPSCSEL